nr:C-type natriuretic peptide [Pogona vitticeps]
MRSISSIVLLLLLLPPLASQTPIRSPQSLLEMLGEDLARLVSDIEGDPSSLPQDSLAQLLGKPHPLLSRDMPGPSGPPPDRAWALLFHDLLNARKKFRGRSKKILAPQGCFGIKLDRIGTLSGLGC